jgi:hypothetical protein
MFKHPPAQLLHLLLLSGIKAHKRLLFKPWLYNTTPENQTTSLDTRAPANRAPANNNQSL